MKSTIHVILVGVLFFLAIPVKSQSMIAVQNDSGSSFYSSLDSAITYADDGSYIYIPGGSFTVSKPINKELHIVGVGHNPDSCAVTGISEVIGTFTIKSGSDHSSITGLKILGGISFSVGATDPVVNYFEIERCNVRGEIYLSNYFDKRSSHVLINECIISGRLYGYYTQQFQLSKSIIESGELYYFDSNAYFTNNIFLKPSNNNICINTKNTSFKNNIFLGYVYSNHNDQTYNQFQNNLFNLGKSLSSLNVFQNDIIGPVTTLFVNQPGNVFDYKQDYHILESSPAHNAGTDGTDLGIYGTGSPWKEGSLPNNPHIQSKSISTIDGNLNVKIKVAAQDN